MPRQKVMNPKSGRLVYRDGRVGHGVIKKKREKRQRQERKEEKERQERKKQKDEANRRAKKNNELETVIRIRIKGKKVPPAEELVAKLLKSTALKHAKLVVLVDDDKLVVKKNVKGRYYYAHM